MSVFNHIGTFATAPNDDASGLSDSVLHVSGGQTFLYTLAISETVDVVAYSVAPNGTLTQIDAQSLPYNLTTNPAPALVISQGTNSTTLVVNGLGDTQLHELRLAPNGSIQSVVTSDASSASFTFGQSVELTVNGTSNLAAIDPNTGQISLWSVNSHGQVGQAAPNSTTTLDTAQTDLAAATFNGGSVVLSVSAQGNTLASHTINAAGDVTQTDLWSPEKGLWVSAPTAVEIVTVAGVSFGIIASAGSSSLTVVQIAPDGSLSITDHLLDSLDTRFDQAQVLGVVEYEGRAFVAAAGADDGITLFELLQNGQLLALGTIADQTNTTLDSISSLQLSVHDGALTILVGSASEVGITALGISVATTGIQVWGTENSDQVHGTAGDDILIDSLGDDTFFGGDGADFFVFVKDDSANVIRDFNPLEDRLDLSGWDFLRTLDQVSFTQMSNGATILFGGQSIRIFTEDKTPLTWDLFVATADIIGSRMLPSWTGPVLEPDDNTPPPPPDGLFTVTGTPGTDTLSGTLSDDVILGLADNDTMTGLGGADHIYGDLGNDLVNGNAGSDYLYGGAGNDRINGGIGWDSIMGGDGDDILRANDGLDWVAGGTGDDTIYGNNGDDTLLGQYGDDLIYGGLSADIIYGGDGHDSLFADNGPDQVFGDDGNDFIKGNAGFDTLYGGDGDDTLYGGLSNDTLYGDAGNDILFADNGSDRLFGGTGDDDLFGNSGFDTLFGGSGNDSLSGGLQNDTLFGGDGNDALFGDDGKDVLDGGAGNDQLYGGAGQDDFIFNGGTDTIHDFRTNEDQLLLDTSLWGGGALTETALLSFQTSSSDTALRYDFGDGNVLILTGLGSTEDIYSNIEFI